MACRLTIQLERPGEGEAPVPAVRFLRSDASFRVGDAPDCDFQTGDAPIGNLAFILHPGPDPTSRQLECGPDAAGKLRLNGSPVAGSAHVEIGDEIRLGPWTFRLTAPRRAAARRKKTDGLARLAQLSLALILAGEFLIALWLPYRIRKSNLWSRQILAQKTTMHLDQLRKIAGKIHPADPLEIAARNLVAGELNRLAEFLRTAQDRLGPRHWRRIEKDLDGYEKVLNQIQTHRLAPSLPSLRIDRAVQAILAQKPSPPPHAAPGNSPAKTR